MDGEAEESFQTPNRTVDGLKMQTIPKTIENYGTAVEGLTLTVVRTGELKEGDMIISLSAQQVGYQKPTEVLAVEEVVKKKKADQHTFYDVAIREGKDGITSHRVSDACIFGRIKE